MYEEAPLEKDAASALAVSSTHALADPLDPRIISWRSKRRVGTRENVRIGPSRHGCLHDF